METPDYTNVKENLMVIVNKFADRGYSKEAIALVQRFYFRYYDRFGNFTSNELIDKLTYCFSPDKNSQSELSQKISSTFGIYREDKFAFLFEDSLSSSTIKVMFFDVKPTTDFTWTNDLETHCIFSTWVAQNGDDVHDRNLESYLHTIVYQMNQKSASVFDIRLAQLIYCSFVADTEYRADGIELLIETVMNNSDVSDNLRENLWEHFRVNISTNQMISAYYQGITDFNEGVRNDG